MNNECYSNEIECKVIDNFLMLNNRGVGIYEEILNGDNQESSSYSKLALTSKYNRTFAANDPLRMLASGRPATDAAFQQKIDGHGFRNNPCENIKSESDLNIEPINFYNYQLSASLTQYISAESTGEKKSISDKRNTGLGEIWCRNTLSNRIDRLQTMLPGLRTQPEIYNNVIDFDVIYDSVILYTPDTMYIERYSYDYNTGDILAGDATPIISKADDIELSKLIRVFFNEANNTVVFGKTVQYDVKTVIPELYSYNIATGTYVTAYGKNQAEQDMKHYKLPPDLYRDFDIKSISTPIVVYNDKLQKYTVIYSAYLATTYTGMLTGEFEGDVYCVFIHNYKALANGLGYIDSIIYHPENKREYRYDESIPPKTITLDTSAREIEIGYVLPASLTLTIDPLDVPLRRAKLKEIQYQFGDVLITKSRLPVNDMGLAGVDNISRLTDSYTPHVSGGAIDFASPRYQRVHLPIESNISDVSIVTVNVSARYYDGFVDVWKIAGEIRPRPLTYKFKDMVVVDAVSYTTNNVTNLLKIIFETQQPRHIVEYIVDNSTSMLESPVESFELETPAVTAVELSGTSLSGQALSGETVVDTSPSVNYTNAIDDSIVNTASSNNTTNTNAATNNTAY